MYNSKFFWLQSQPVLELVKVLSYYGHRFKFVGGCVRDSILGLHKDAQISNIDFDIASSFKPKENLNLLKDKKVKIIPLGEQHGTIIVLINGISFQITTLRKDIQPDGRHSKVKFCDSFYEDAKRRDFTFNALYLDPKDVSIIDYFNGQEHLLEGKVEFIGNPLNRIQEDYLRILRFFRFCALYGKSSPSHTVLDIIKTESINLAMLSKERISSEFYKTITASNPSSALKLMLNCDIFQQILDAKESAINNFNEILEVEKLTGLYDTNTRIAFIMSSLTNNKVILKKNDLTAIENIILLRNFVQQHNIIEYNEICELLGYYPYKNVVASLILSAGDNANLKYHYINIVNIIKTKSLLSFPINGNDLINLGIQEGSKIREILHKLKILFWQNNPHKNTKEYFIDIIKSKYLKNDL